MNGIRQWIAPAAIAAAVYVTPTLLFAAWSRVGWAFAALVPCAVALVLYGRRLHSALGVLAALVVVGFVEFVTWLGVSAAESCGSSMLATVLEWSGAGVLLIGAGTLGVARHRLLPFVAALVLAGVWYAVVAHVIPGGAAECFD